MYSMFAVICVTIQKKKRKIYSIYTKIFVLKNYQKKACQIIDKVFLKVLL